MSGHRNFVFFKYFEKWEPIAFWSLALFNLLPVLGVGYFLTGDGPAHLYNAHLISQIISEPEGIASQFFYIREWLIPNLGGHLFLTIGIALFGPAMAEKLLYATILFGFVVGFRYMVYSIDSSRKWVSWFGLILAHHFCFYIGFQSFSLALGLMFFIIGMWHRGYFHNHSYRVWIAVVALLALTICHVVPLLIALMYIALAEMFYALDRGALEFRRLFLVALISLPSVVFVLIYILTAPAQDSGTFPDFISHAYNLYSGTTLITIHQDERVYVAIFQLILLACFIPLLVSFKKLKSVRIQISTCLLLLLVYFVVPDSMATGGFISVRIMLFIYIFASMSVGLVSGNGPMAAVIVLLAGILSVSLVRYHYKTMSKLSDHVAAVSAVNDYIEPGKTLLPLNYSHHWLDYNIGLYAGAYKKIVVLDNYEASKTAFPLAWKENMDPGDRLGNFGYSKTPSFHWRKYESETGAKLDYVLRYGFNKQISDSETLATSAKLSEYFTLIFQDESMQIELWMKK